MSQEAGSIIAAVELLDAAMRRQWERAADVGSPVAMQAIARRQARRARSAGASAPRLLPPGRRRA